MVPSVNDVRSTAPTTQSLPTLVAETTIADVPESASSIDTDTLAASADILDRVKLTCPTSEAFVPIGIEADPPEPYAVKPVLSVLLSVKVLASTRVIV